MPRKGGDWGENLGFLGGNVKKSKETVGKSRDRPHLGFPLPKNPIIHARMMMNVYVRTSTKKAG